MSETRAVRDCDACGQSDDHPRHSVMTEDGGVTLVRHMDCCSSAGCPDGSCDSILASAGDRRGEALIGFLTGGPGGDG
jgi:hypothetical protein